MKKYQTLYYDDITGEEIPESGTVHFSYQGVDYEIDLSASSEAKFLNALQPYLNACRVAPKTKVKLKRRDKSYRDKRKDIRRWAAEQGFKLLPNGRIPVHVVRAYEEAH